MTDSTMSKSDREWEADSDARTIISYAKLVKDPKRLKRAKSALGKIQKEAEESQKRNGLEAEIAKKLRGIGGNPKSPLNSSHGGY